MGKRGDELRHQMLHAAKDVFLEVGFERASMDVIAARAETTKRTLYAHFDNKESLFLAVVDMVRGLLLERLKLPGEYAPDPREALVRFCGKFLETLVWQRSLRMVRLSIAETERFPDGAAKLHEALFDTAQDRLEAFLHQRLKLSLKASAHTASALIARVLYPRFVRALFGLDVMTDAQLHDDRISEKIDLAPVREAVKALVPKPGK